MLQIQQEQIMIDALSQLLKLQKCPTILSYCVLMLPDNAHSKLFARLSQLLDVEEETVHEQFNLLVLKYIATSFQIFQNSNPSKIPVNRRSCYNLQENRPRTQSKQSIEFQNLFAECVQKVIRIEENDNKKLCHKVTNHLQNCDGLKFWKEMHELIPDKSTVQLREYFQNSFKRFMHQEFINKEDKMVLKDLINEMKDKKPAEIADKFMEMTADRNYFKRNVLMYVVNVQSKLRQRVL
ncbi:Hypothetical_protein [Hexamita inflata]|uniref:Hypothetical_protein n=1 Tax=Hexamita inflata TaxID=28002 RepID=A0AA86RXQ7_9EUKA|nr:Hypothetical protein HINF_LOCUS62125 [Hexamita inflata]